MVSTDAPAPWSVPAATGVALLPTLAVVLLVPILVGTTGGAPIDPRLADALVVGWLVVVFVVFVLGATIATRIYRDGGGDAETVLRLALARGDVDPDGFRQRMELLDETKG